MELRGIVPAIVPAPPPEPFAVQVTSLLIGSTAKLTAVQHCTRSD